MCVALMALKPEASGSSSCEKVSRPLRMPHTLWDDSVADPG